MRKLQLTIIALILLPLFSFSQDFWEELYFPDSVSIQCLATNNQGHIFIGTGQNNETGGVYRSTDNGQSWELVYDNDNFGVLSIAINKDGYIYVGKNGFEIFAVSDDNGENWEEIELPTNGNIVEILCVGSDTIYVGAAESGGGRLIRSIDSGNTWDNLFLSGNPSEFISDIAISSTGDIYVSIGGYFLNTGGVYKSGDGGETWEFLGLNNHQVFAMAINSTGDIFTGDWYTMGEEYPGIYALYNGDEEFELMLGATDCTDIVIDEDDNIYATANEWVVRSFDNGQSFEYISDELSAVLRTLHIDNNGFLFGTKKHHLVKSLSPIITSINNYSADVNESTCVFPNPVIDILYIRTELISSSTGYCKINIYDVFGNIVFENKKFFFEDIIYLNLHELEPGFYLISIQKDDNIFNSSFIKK